MAADVATDDGFGEIDSADAARGLVRGCSFEGRTRAGISHELGREFQWLP